VARTVLHKKVLVDKTILALPLRMIQTGERQNVERSETKSIFRFTWEAEHSNN